MKRDENQTKRRFDDSYFRSFGLECDDGVLTNAGALFADDSPIYQNRIFCTRWNGLDKSAGVMDSIDDKEYTGSVLSLFEYGKTFVKTNSRKMWHKLPSRRVDFPEYPERRQPHKSTSTGNPTSQPQTVNPKRSTVQVDRTSRPYKSTVQVDRTSRPYKSPPQSDPTSREKLVAAPENRARLMASLLMDGPLSRQELMAQVGLRHRASFYTLYILPSLDIGFIEYTIPDKPNSRLQKYRITAKGRAELRKGTRFAEVNQSAGRQRRSANNPREADVPMRPATTIG